MKILKTNLEYRKNILFIRLKGRFDQKEYNQIINSITELGIKCIVLNLKELKPISLNEIKNIDKLNKGILKKKNQLLIIDKEVRNTLFSNIVKINSEIEAFSLI